jgi:hypothetical protein
LESIEIEDEMFSCGIEASNMESSKFENVGIGNPSRMWI